jgi:hypothetical protein
MAKQRQTRIISNIRGRDGSTTADIAIPVTRAKEVRNADFYKTPFARKRNGCEAVFPDTTSEAFTDILASLGRHVPADTETAAALWGVDADYVIQYLTGGTAWATPSVKAAINANAYDVRFVSFNGKLWILANTASDRSQVWDGTSVRFVGLATPAAPTGADQGVPGVALAATLRYYRVRYERRSGSTVIARSEASASLSFTPSGTGTHVRITKPASLSEGETHWSVEVSIDNSVWWIVTTGIVVATTTYDDNTTIDALPSTLSQVTGEHIAPISHKYGVVDGNRILLAGAWEATTYTSRVWFTPRLGTSAGDDERIPNSVDHQNWIDLDEKDGDAITALNGPFEGMPIVFKYRHIWGLRPTGSDTKPYQPLIISKIVGAIRQELTVMAEDEHGNPALYFWSHRGPYRYGINGLQFCGEDLRDLIETVNLDATTVVGFAVHHTDKHQIWWWLATGTSNTPDLVCVFDTRLGEPDEDGLVRDGWSTFDGTIAEARCAVMFSDTLAASMSRDLKPYLGTGVAGTSALLLKGDTGQLDNAVEYAGYVTLPEQHLAGLHTKCMVDQIIVLGKAGLHTFQVDLHRDYGCEPRADTVAMAPETDDQTRCQKSFEAAFQADAKSVGLGIGDICPIGYPWEIDAIVIQYENKEPIAP